MDGKLPVGAKVYEPEVAGQQRLIVLPVKVAVAGSDDASSASESETGAARPE
jgi:hypothetical protein